MKGTGERTALDKGDRGKAGRKMKRTEESTALDKGDRGKHGAR